MENAKEEVEIGWKIVYMKVHKPLKLEKLFDNSKEYFILYY